MLDKDTKNGTKIKCKVFCELENDPLNRILEKNKIYTLKERINEHLNIPHKELVVLEEFPDKKFSIHLFENIKVKLTPEKIIKLANENTYWRVASKNSLITYALNMSNDPNKKDRLKAQLCVHCFYREGVMAGQAFTDKDCEICQETQMYSSTNKDDLCLPCAVENGLCKHCSSSINLRSKK